MESLLIVVVVIVVGLCVPGIPGYVIAQRRGVRNPWVAFVPLFGLWIVLCESVGRRGWLALVVLVPYIGALALSIWMAFEAPSHHGRTRWWAAALSVPLLNLAGYWAYAFTLSRRAQQLSLPTSIA